MKSVVVAFLVACALTVSAFRWAEGTTRDFLAVLGIDKTTAETDVFNSIWYDYANHPTGARVRALVVGDRPALAREELRPEPPEVGPQSGEVLAPSAPTWISRRRLLRTSTVGGSSPTRRMR